MPDRYGSISINEEQDSQEEKKPPFRRPVAPKKRRKGGNWLFVWAALAAFAISFYFLAALYLAPMALQKYLPGYMAKATGLDLTMGKVELNPFNFQLSFSDIKADLPGSTTGQPLLEIPSLFIDMDLTSLLRNSFVCDQLSIKKLSLNITRFKDNHYNLPVLTQISEKQNKEQIIDFTNLPFLFSLNNIDISDSHILLTDQTTDKVHTVEQLNLAIPTLSNFSFQLNDYILPHFSALINGSFIQLDGKKIASEDGKNFKTKLFCSIKELQLSSYLSYLPENFPLILTKGVADLNLELGFSPEKKQGERISIDINMTGSDIFLHTRKGNNKISLPTVRLDATLTPVNRLLHIKTIVAKKPQLVTGQEQLPRGLANFLAIGSPSSKRLGLTIDLLLFDEGRLVFTDRKDSVWNALQLTINDFDRTNSTGSFHLSGEQAVGPGFFSWQGKLSDSGTLKGKILLNKFPSQTILAQLYTHPEAAISGSSELTGDLTLSTLDKTTTTYSLDNATLQFHNLQLTEKKKVWLKADSVRFTRLSRQDTRFSLGNIFLKNAALVLTHNDYPPFFAQVFGEKKRPAIRGIDFSGTLTLNPQNEQKETLLFSDVTFQANRIDQQVNAENFVFSAKLGDEGIVKTRGKLRLFPLTIATDVTFSDMDSALFSPYSSKWPLLQHSEAMLHGKGVFKYPALSFQGDVRLSDGRLQRESNTSLFSWDVAALDKVQCTFSPFSLRGSSLNVQSPQLQYRIRTESPFQLLSEALQNLLSKDNEHKDLFPVHINKITVKDGVVSLLDTRLSPQWKQQATAITGHVNNVNSKDKGITSFDLNGNVEDAAFNLSGSLFLFQEKKNNRARLSLTNFPLHSFSKQLQNSQLRTNNTTISLQSRYVENALGTSSSTELKVSDLAPLSEKSAAALALALLKDSSGTFPLTVQRDNWGKSLFQETLNNFQTTVIKASYAPLLLDRDFKDLQDNNFVSFQPGTSTINAAGKELLIRYSELLAAHPGLALSITGLADAKADRRAMVKTVPPAKPLPVPDNALLTLAKERSLITYDFCIHSLGIAPSRLSINDSPFIRKDSPAHGSSLDIKALITKN
jgi:Domain of Unknown Function (DUF748)